MKTMETDEDDLLGNYKNSTKSKSKPLNVKKIIFFSRDIVINLFYKQFTR